MKISRKPIEVPGEGVKKGFCIKFCLYHIMLFFSLLNFCVLVSNMYLKKFVFEAYDKRNSCTRQVFQRRICFSSTLSFVF